MAQEWRISWWVPVLTLPLGLVGLLLALGALQSGEAWYETLPWILVGAVGVATALFGCVDRRRAVVRLTAGRLHFQLATGGMHEVDLTEISSVTVRKPRILDRRPLLVMQRADGSTLAFPAWAAWQRQDELVDRLARELVGAGARLSPAATRALRLVGV